jgi:FtsP/CotA-like multicopper oxidase with cupredoxin domain
MKPIYFLALSLLFAWPSYQANATEYTLDINREPVTITGKPIEKITVNGNIPGPVLRFKEGDEAVITVNNLLGTTTSVHWHGLLLPGAMDGVDGLNGFTDIKPHSSFTYRFPLRQSGTYWYHSHTNGQEQDGLYGPIIVEPKKEVIKADREYVVMLSDFSREESGDILGNLKKASDYYNRARRTVGDFIDDVNRDGFGPAWENAKMWGQMRMSPTDLADVSGYTFLINGNSPEQNWTGLFKVGERVRLRFINASAMSFYDVRIPGLKMEVVQSDGRNVEPVRVDEFRFAVAETYDVVVTPTEDKAYTIVAEPIDRSGFALGTLATQEGMKGEMPAQRPRALLTMADMGMAHGDMAGMHHSMMGHDMAGMEGMDMGGMEGMSMGESGWAKAGTPAGMKALSYADLRSLAPQKDTRDPTRTITVRLGGNMERYIWTLNGKTTDEAKPIKLKYGERVRLKFINETMMAHPMHLHGMFVQLENGQPAAKMPDKHVVIVPPGQSYSVLLTADEPGEWSFHCHLLYHMASGMMTKVVVAQLDAKDKPEPQPKQETKSEGVQHHAQ